MRHLRNAMVWALLAFLAVLLSSSIHAQNPGEFDPGTGDVRTVKTILLLTSYPVADIVTGNFFDAFRKGIRELNLPIDCHVVELNATVRDREAQLDRTFDRLSTQINSGIYSAIVTLNNEAAKMIMTHYKDLSRNTPVLFAGLGRVPPDLKRTYPNSTAIGIPEDAPGTLELGMKLFPETQKVVLVADDSTISEETRNAIVADCKRRFPQLDFIWMNAEQPKQVIKDNLADLPAETIILFFPSHDYANGHDETFPAFVRNIAFDQRFPCLALDDTLLGNGIVVGGDMIEMEKLGQEAARVVAHILNSGSGAERIAPTTVPPTKIVDYSKFKSYKLNSGGIPHGVKVRNKPETMWTRHWKTFLMFFFAALILAALQFVYLNWMRRRLRLSRNMLYSLPGRVIVVNRAETILFASWIKDGPMGKSGAPKKLDELVGIDYAKLSQAINDVFLSGRQFTIEYSYEDAHRAISFAPLEHEIFGQDAVICFSLDNTELQNARREAEKYSAQLKKTTRMWDILINFLPIHIYAKDIDDDFRYVFNNRTRCMFYGVGENELNEKTDFDFLPREFAEKMRHEDEEFVAQPDQAMQERNMEVKSWDGRTQHLRCIQRIFTDEDGTRLLLGTAVNITELEEARIQMQQLNGKLQELLEQHSVLLDNMTSIVLTKDVDDDFRITTCNEACLKFLDKPMSDIIGKTDFDILPREDAESIHAEDLHAIEVLELRPEYHSMGNLRDMNGRSRIGRFVRKLIRTSDGHSTLFTLFHDVTDLENAKHEAEENASRFLITLQSIGDGVITTDEHGYITLVNPNAESMLGCKQDAMLGKPHTDFFRIVHEQTGKPISSPLTAALRSGVITEGADQTDLISADGHCYHIDSNAAPIRKRSGEIAGAILVFRDVTDERNKREELRQAMANMENASEMARLAFFRFELSTRRRSGSSLLSVLWPNDENGEPMRFEDWVYPDDVAIFAREEGALERSGKHGESTTFSFRVGDNANLRYYRAMITLDLSVPDEPSVFGILQDVTELSQSMMKLKDTQALWDAAINAIPIMFTVKDIDDDFRYLLCNNAFASIFNLTTQDIVGRTDLEIFRGEEHVIQIAGRMNNPAQEADAMASFEEELVDYQGRRHFIKTVTRVIQDTSGRRLLLAASSDVTDMQNLLIIERISSELLSHFNREPVFDRVMDRIADTLRKELGCSRIVIAAKEDNGVFTISNQWHYDGLREIRLPQVILRKLGWEKRVEEAPEGGVIRIDDFPEFIRSIGLNLDRGAGDGKLEASFISSPVYENKKLIGGIFLSFLQDRREFADLDETIITSCAGIVSLARQRERSQQAVRQALLENQMILDNIDIPIWLFNTENKLIRTNAAVARIADRPHPIADPAENERVFRDFTSDLKKTGFDNSVGPDASKRQRTNYRDHDYIIATESVRDNRGNQLYNMKYAVDVTNLNRLIQNQKFVNAMLEDIIGEEDFDECLRRTLENVCKLLGASRGCLLRHEEDGTKAHCVAEFVEPTHGHADVRMFGRTLSRVVGILENTPDKRTFVCNDMHAFDWSPVGNDWKQAAAAIELRAIFLSNIVCNGEVWGTVSFTFEGINHKFVENDNVLLRATAHMIELVLSRKRAKALIMDALERAQAADKAKSFFIASVSHEIRTPLNSVIGFAELLREGGVSKDQEKEYLDAISTSANALLMLINDVLDLSKLEANQMQIITAFTDFNALCREVMLIFTFRAQENGNKLVFNVPELPELEIDSIRVRQILINLLGNAVKFTKKGSITLLASFTPDPGSSDEGTLSFSVRDTGIGISEDDQKKLMEPFVQLSRMRGTNAVNNGTGLGLSISKRLAICMNGNLSCTSRIGEGSTFSVTLYGVHFRKAEAGSKPDRATPVQPAASRDLSAIRILVVDDVPMNLRVAKALFAKIGFNNVFIASSGREALELLAKQPVDLILSDMWMPEMNGAQLSAEIKGNPEYAHIPIVAQTADVESGGNFDMSHFDAIILKPITKEKLSNMVRRVMGDGTDGEGLAKGDGPVNLG